MCDEMVTIKVNSCVGKSEVPTEIVNQFLQQFEKRRATFWIDDILSVASDRMVSLRGMDAVYDVLSFFAGYQVMTHEIPALIDKYQPQILEQHPFLKDIDCTNQNFLTIGHFIEAIRKQYGKKLDLEAIVEQTEPVDGSYRQSLGGHTQ